MGSISRQAMLDYYAPGELSRSILSLPERGVVYVRVPKAACSTLKLWLHKMHTGDHEAELGNVHREHLVPRGKDVGWPVVCRMLEGDAYRFTFVRHPADRAVSAYRNKIVSGTGRAGSRLRETLGLPDDAEVTFDQFLATMENAEPRTWDPHWRPQHLLTMRGLVDYDHVGRVESFDRDLAAIREAAGLPDVPAVLRGRHPVRGEAPLDGRPDLVRRVEALFAADYEAFGY